MQIVVMSRGVIVEEGSHDEVGPSENSLQALNKATHMQEAEIS